MSSQPIADDTEQEPTERDSGRARRSSRRSTRAPFELPAEQAIALAQITSQGVREAELEYRLGTTSAEAARATEILLRRRLIRRTPPGRIRHDSRLVLTERGEQALGWLDHLQFSLPETLFEPPDPLPPGPLRITDGLVEPARRPERSSGLFAKLHHLWSPRATPDSDPSIDSSPDETYGRGLLNVGLGSGLFAASAVVGILQQSERATLTALGVGCLLAVFFFLRAAAVMLRHGRLRSWFARRLRRLGADRVPRWPRRRPGSRRVPE